ncbi:DUF3987 domain-containing protein [Pantoea sp. B9002]|uniref:YfjI family protein n=1 Tax=Pantoea sp. B9002 TaxID=2726979 RepID=UPI0015A28E08|nr:YfjI family protein [Pantoea sp. B9002]NWA61598.1 DUF3987 domain-containing protein [Pantoea sp. B9002]
MSMNDEFPYRNLPKQLNAMIFEIQRRTKAPLALIIASMLGAISLVCQRRINVERPGQLEGPVSLFMITIAESGERKSTVDSMIMRPILQIDEENAESYRLARAIFDEEMELFLAQKQALMSRLKSETKLDLDTDNTKERLKALEIKKPVMPIRQRWLINDVTPAALKHILAEEGASTGLMSDEAGMLFGGKALEQLPMLNKVWDGGPFIVDRANATQITVKDVRMTMLLMAQPSVVESFLHRGKGEARDTGFLARCLMCYPQSTQGTRQIEQGDTSAEYLNLFHKRLVAIATMPTDGSRIIMRFNNDAEQSWLDFYNKIERLIGEPGYYSLNEFKDYASKMPENVARLSALIEYFYTGKNTICLRAVNIAIEIIEWYGHHFIELVGKKENALDDSNILFNWLKEYCSKNNARNLSKNTVLQYGPNRFRNLGKLNALLEILQGRNLIYINHNGKAKVITVNYWMD